MENCPKCGHHAVAYDGYRQEMRCHYIGCTMVVIDSFSYSILRYDLPNKEVHRVKIEGGFETGIVKTYKLDY